MSKASLIGGIYNRPIALANWTHFFIAVLALIKGVLANPSLSYVIWSIAIIYSIFAILFGIGEGALNASTNTLFADKAPKGYEGLTMGLLRTFGDLGFMIGPPILGFIIQKWNYSSALLIDGIILAVCSSLVIFFTAETKIKKNY